MRSVANSKRVRQHGRRESGSSYSEEEEMIVTSCNALVAEDKDIMDEVIGLNETCHNICSLRHVTVTYIHMGERVCYRIRDLVAQDYFYGKKITELIEVKGNSLYLKVDGGLPRIKIQEKCGGTLTMRPWSLTVAPIVNKGDRNFRA